jgi:hypothetical protein
MGSDWAARSAGAVQHLARVARARLVAAAGHAAAAATLGADRVAALAALAAARTAAAAAWPAACLAATTPAGACALFWALGMLMGAGVAKIPWGRCADGGLQRARASRLMGWLARQPCMARHRAAAPPHCKLAIVCAPAAAHAPSEPAVRPPPVSAAVIECMSSSCSHARSALISWLAQEALSAEHVSA